MARCRVPASRVALALSCLCLNVTGGLLLDIHMSDDASFDVRMGDKVWLQSGPLRIFADGRWHNASNPRLNSPASLVRTGARQSVGADELGSYSLLNVSWSVLALPSVVLHTSLKVYREGYAIFSQEIPHGASGTNASNPVLPQAGDLDEGAYPPVVPFPSFQGRAGQLSNLGYVTWQGCMVKVDYGVNVLEHFQGLSTNGPVAVFDESASVLVVSPMDNFKNAVHTYVEGTAWETGISSELTSLPPGFMHRTLMVAGTGITATMAAWGKIIRKAHGTERLVGVDPVVNYLSYWTDNGAYYYGDKWGVAGGGGNPVNETSMLAVADHLAKADLLDSVRIWQLDDWWYPGPQKVFVHCVRNWTLTSPAFNHSLGWLSRKVQTPWLLYVPFFCPDNVYTDKFDFVLSTDGQKQFAEPHPDRAVDFYRALFEYGAQQGMAGFENDFLNFNFLGMPIFRRQFGASQKWLQGIDTAAMEHGLPVQMCMALPSDLMQSLQMNSVTNYRASGDYADLGNYDIGGSALLAFALGLRPSKDNFWTHRPQSAIETGKPWSSTSNPGSNCELNAIISTLSTGPVGIADKAGDTNKTLVMRSIRKDGLILQPDRPASYVDAMFLQSLGSHRPPLKGQVWTTHAAIHAVKGPSTWHYALSMDVNMKWQLSQSDFYPRMDVSAGWVARRWHEGHQPRACIAGQKAVKTGCIMGPAITSDSDMPWTRNDRPVMVENDTHVYDLVQIAPIAPNGWVLLGEIDKYVSVSSKRFQRIEFLPSSVRLTICGAADEVVRVTVLRPTPAGNDWLIVTRDVTFGGEQASLTVELSSAAVDDVQFV